jgi:hypothetical protein
MPRNIDSDTFEPEKLTIDVPSYATASSATGGTGGGSVDAEYDPEFALRSGVGPGIDEGLAQDADVYGDGGSGGGLGSRSSLLGGSSSISSSAQLSMSQHISEIEARAGTSHSIKGTAGHRTNHDYHDDAKMCVWDEAGTRTDGLTN